MDCNTMYISNVETTTDSVILIPNRSVKTITNATSYRLIICCNVSATANLPVFIRTAVGDIPCLCKFANTLYANQLNKRTPYKIGYGNANDNYDIGQIVVLSNVSPKSEPTISPASL